MRSSPWELQAHGEDQLSPRPVPNFGAPVKTGELKGMKESDSEGIANHTGPKPCVGVRKDEGEASAGVHAGWPSNCEIGTPWREPRRLQGADTLEFSGSNTERADTARHTRTLRGLRPHARMESTRTGTGRS